MDAKCMRCKHNGTVICNKCDMFFDEFEPIETPTPFDVSLIINTDSCKIDSSPTIIAATKCQICDGFIPVYDYQRAYPLICNECRKRLKKLLYRESEGE